MPGVVHNAVTELKNTVIQLKAAGNSKDDIISIIQQSNTFTGIIEFEQTVGIVHDALDGVSHTLLAARYPHHANLFPNILIALTDADPSVATPEVLVKGIEFQANTVISNFQRDASVAGLANGGFVVTWESNEQDGHTNEIYGQVYDQNNIKMGVEFRVNTFIFHRQRYPSVAGLTNGGFVVTWSSLIQDGDNEGIYGQVYDQNNIKMGVEFQINTFIFHAQTNPSVVGLTNGGFVVVWGTFVRDVRGQVYDQSNIKMGSEFVVASSTEIYVSPSVASLTNGGFVVTWTSGSGQDGDNFGISGQVYDQSNMKVGVDFQVNTYTTDAQQNPSVAGLTNGGFIVTWESEGQEMSGKEIYMQVYDQNNIKLDGELRVNIVTTNDQQNPSVTSLTSGGFVITWHSLQDGSGNGVYGQAYDQNNAKVGGEFQVNTHTTNDQQHPSVANLTNGGFVVAWESFIQDGSNFGIYGQVYDAIGF